MNKLDKILLGCVWTVGALVALTLIALPFVTYADFGLSGPFLFSSILLLFVVLAVWCGL